MKNILVVPDIHGRKFWREVVDVVDKFDKIVFLGDYLDPYPYEHEDNPGSMESDLTQMLLDIIQFKTDNPERVILLTGNHTDHYMWLNKVVESSRFDRTNCKKYNKIFQENIDLFNLIYQYRDDILFSHAGITHGWAMRVWEYMGFSKDNYDFIAAIKILLNCPLSQFENFDLLSDISWYRGGVSRYGSCEWADLREHIDSYEVGKPIWHDYSPLFQIFGHTQVNFSLIESSLACLDCRKLFVVDKTETVKIKPFNRQDYE